MIGCIRYCISTLLVVALASLAGCSSGPTYEQAEAAARNGEHEKAIKLFSELAKTSNDPGVFGNRANCYSYLGNLDAALADYQTAFELVNARSPRGNDPILPYLYYNRGYAYDRADKYQLAVADYEKTIELQPNYPDVKNSLAWMLSTCPDASVRNPKRAVELADQELARAPEDPNILDTAAACYASAGDFSRAASTQEKAVSLCPDTNAKQEFVARWELYRQRKAYVEPE